MRASIVAQARPRVGRSCGRRYETLMHTVNSRHSSQACVVVNDRSSVDIGYFMEAERKPASALYQACVVLGVYFSTRSVPGASVRTDHEQMCDDALAQWMLVARTAHCELGYRRTLFFFLFRNRETAGFGGALRMFRMQSANYYRTVLHYRNYLFPV